MGFLEDLWSSIDFVALLNQFISGVPALAATLAKAAAVLVAFWIGFRLVKRLLHLYAEQIRMPGAISDLLVTLLKYVVFVLAVVTAASQFGFEMTSVLAGLGVVGLAVSFAAQDTFGNIISGITLVVDKPFAVGDWVELGGIHAYVTRITLRTTTLTTFDNQSIVIPNKLILQERIVNYTLVPRIRARVPIGIAYKEDIRTARQVLLATLKDDADVLAEPSPQVVVTDLGASSINLELRFWIEDAPQQLPKQWEYTEKCKYALDEAGIEIPFPHLQFFLEQTAGLQSLADSIAAA